MTKIIGIDPAPSKKNTVYDGNDFHSYCYGGLKDFLKKIKTENENVLICWDAPLSFSMKDVTNKTSPLYKRKIEYFFSLKDAYKTPTGISVLGYAGCSHWVISQYLLGFPKISSFERNFIPPFELIFDKKDISHSVTEVHPAVAIWLWLKAHNSKVNNWNYKKDKNSFKNLKHELIQHNIIPENIEMKNDDYLDAYIAWKLGREWVEDKNNVEILGNANTGSFLLPYDNALFKKFNNYKF